MEPKEQQKVARFLGAAPARQDRRSGGRQAIYVPIDTSEVIFLLASRREDYFALRGLDS
jgi:hypothetical protein